jgi:hypothetical protein
VANNQACSRPIAIQTVRVLVDQHEDAIADDLGFVEPQIGPLGLLVRL